MLTEFNIKIYFYSLSKYLLSVYYVLMNKKCFKKQNSYADIQYNVNLLV